MTLETVRFPGPLLNDPVALMGFPSVGLVGSITANHCVSQLNMEPLAGLGGTNMPPYCLISDGVALPPIRIYGKKSKTKTGRDLIVCTSEYAPKPEDCFEVVAKILSELRIAGCRNAVCLEGVPKTGENDAPVIIPGNEDGRRMAETSGLSIMENGMIKGVPGVTLYLGSKYGIGVSAIMCPANPTMPDPGAAVGFVEPISKMIKGVKLNPKILMAEDAEIRRKAAEMASIPEESANTSIYG